MLACAIVYAVRRWGMLFTHQDEEYEELMDFDDSYLPLIQYIPCSEMEWLLFDPQYVVEQVTAMDIEEVNEICDSWGLDEDVEGGHEYGEFLSKYMYVRQCPDEAATLLPLYVCNENLKNS